VLEENQETKEMFILENMKYEEYPPPIISEKHIGIHWKKSSTYCRSSQASHLLNIKSYYIIITYIDHLSLTTLGTNQRPIMGSPRHHTYLKYIHNNH
jgi:hypothetical protein